jgi:hypothetical protein
LQKPYDPIFISAKSCQIPSLSPLVGELQCRLRRISVNSGGLLLTGEEHQVRMAWRPDLQAICQAGLLPDKVLHQPQRRSAESIILPDTIDHGGLRHTGAANPIATLE